MTLSTIATLSRNPLDRLPHPWEVYAQMMLTLFLVVAIGMLLLRFALRKGTHCIGSSVCVNTRCTWAGTKMCYSCSVAELGQAEMDRRYALAHPEDEL